MQPPVRLSVDGGVHGRRHLDRSFGDVLVRALEAEWTRVDGCLGVDGTGLETTSFVNVSHFAYAHLEEEAKFAAVDERVIRTFENDSLNTCPVVLWPPSG